MLRNTFCILLAAAITLSVTAETNAQPGRGGIRPSTAKEKTDGSAEPADTGRGGRPAGTAADPSAGRRGGRGGRSSDGQPPFGTAAGAGNRFGGGDSKISLFAAIDADGDGVITRSEMENAVVAFARLDENKDGKLTREEAGATTGGGHGHSHGGGGRMAGGRGRAGDNQPGQGAGQPQSGGRAGMGKGRGFGRRPEMEQPAEGKEPPPAGKKPAENSSDTNR